jgi:hypothetical protein
VLLRPPDLTLGPQSVVPVTNNLSHGATLGCRIFFFWHMSYMFCPNMQYVQLPYILEAVLPFATSGHAMVTWTQA